MERMCINSYLKVGHDFHLYSYDPSMWNDGLFDANEIVPEEKIKLFPYASIFSDFFRYALLMKRGGWWVDMDTICLKPLDPLLGPFTFARDNIDQYYISGFMMQAPVGSTFMTDCYNWIDGMSPEDRSKLGHMDIGPYLVQRKVPEYSFINYVVGPTVLDPIPWDRITRIVDPVRTDELTEACKDSYVIHLRQSIWNEGPNSCAGILPDGKKLMVDGDYPEDCYWTELKRRFA